jgi:hypothetical protein
MVDLLEKVEETGDRGRCLPGRQKIAVPVLCLH